MANRARLVEPNLPHTAPVAGGGQEAAVRRDIEVGEVGLGQSVAEPRPRGPSIRCAIHADYICGIRSVAARVGRIRQDFPQRQPWQAAVGSLKGLPGIGGLHDMIAGRTGALRTDIDNVVPGPGRSYIDPAVAGRRAYADELLLEPGNAAVQADDHKAACCCGRDPVRINRTHRQAVLPLKYSSGRNVETSTAPSNDVPKAGSIRRSVDAASRVCEELEAGGIRGCRWRGQGREERTLASHDPLKRR